MTTDIATSRRSFIGSSDVAKIIGVSTYGDAYSLYLEKTGEIERPDIETKVQRRGKILEPAIIEMYRDECPNANLIPGAVMSMQSAHYRAQIDAQELIDGGTRAIPIEIKSASEFTRGKWGPSGSDDAPTDYCAQLHWQMLAMHAPFGRIVALLGADDLRVYTIERDPKVDEFLLERAAEFWQRVQERRPPTINFEHPSVGDTLARLFNKPNATEILQADDAMRSWRDVLVEASERMKQYEAVRDGAKAHLLSLMGNAAIINFGDQHYERKTVKRKGYTVADCTYIDARLKKATSSKAGGLPALTEMEAA
jgi:putative phage-type endonuclease